MSAWTCRRRAKQADSQIFSIRIKDPVTRRRVEDERLTALPSGPSDRTSLRIHVGVCHSVDVHRVRDIVSRHAYEKAAAAAFATSVAASTLLYSPLARQNCTFESSFWAERAVFATGSAKARCGLTPKATPTTTMQVRRPAHRRR